MLSWIGAILGIIPSALNTVDGITKAISNERIAATNAKTEQERIAAQERAVALQAKRDLMIAESMHSNVNVYIRSFMALGPGVFLLKIFLLDKVIGPFFGCVGNIPIQGCAMFVTDPLDVNLWDVVKVILGFYFLYEGAIGVTRIIKS